MARRDIMAVALLLALAVFLEGGCIFDPREPDGPPEGDQTDWETPITTEIVLENLAAALEGESVSNYMDCYTEDFSFEADPQDYLDAGQEAEQRYADWTKAVEQQAINNIFAAWRDIEVVFENFEPPDESVDETYRQEDYTLSLVTQGSTPSTTVVHRGRAVLWMRRSDTGRWAIFRWEDQRPASPGPTETWGVLRGDHRQ